MPYQPGLWYSPMKWLEGWSHCLVGQRFLSPWKLPFHQGMQVMSRILGEYPNMSLRYISFSVFLFLFILSRKQIEDSSSL